MRYLSFTLLVSVWAVIAPATPAQDNDWWLPMQPYWLPMCFLYDEGIDEKVANDSIRAISELYASCGIHLKPFAFTIRSNYPQDAASLQRLTQTACPFKSMFETRGAVQLHSSHKALPKHMCQDSEAVGCSTLCRSHSFSVLGPYARTVEALHESLNSNCCGPVCIDRPRTLQISSEGCAALRIGATSNDVPSWRAKENERYYTRQTLPEKQYDLTANVSFFKDGSPRIAKEVVPPPEPVVVVTSVSGEALLKPVRPAASPAVIEPIVDMTMVDGSFRGAFWRRTQEAGAGLQK